jgi:hypothetical protein
MIKSSNSYFFILLLAFVLISNVTESTSLEGFYNDKRSEKDKNDMMIGFLVVGSIFLGGVALMALYNPLIYLLKIKDNSNKITETRHINYYEELKLKDTNGKDENKNEFAKLNIFASSSTTALFILGLFIIWTVVILIQTGIIPIPGMQVFFYP